MYNEYLNKVNKKSINVSNYQQNPQNHLEIDWAIRWLNTAFLEFVTLLVYVDKT